MKISRSAHAEVMKKLGEEQEVVFSYTQYSGQIMGMIREGVKEWGVRVANLKKAGNKGTKPDDFAADPQAKKSMDALRALLAGLKTKITEAKAHEPETKTRLAAFRKLQKEIADTIADRKGQTSTVLGMGNKSLPDMKKLLASMAEYENSSAFGKIEGWMIGNYDGLAKETATEIDEVLSKTKTEAVSELKDQLAGQALDLRLLYRNMTAAKTLHDQLEPLCNAGEIAIKNANKPQIQATKTRLAEPWKKLSDMATMYRSALSKASMGANSNKDIVAYTKAIFDMHAKLEPRVKKLLAA